MSSLGGWYFWKIMPCLFLHKQPQVQEAQKVNPSNPLRQIFSVPSPGPKGVPPREMTSVSLWEALCCYLVVQKYKRIHPPTKSTQKYQRVLVCKFPSSLTSLGSTSYPRGGSVLPPSHPQQDESLATHSGSLPDNELLSWLPSLP